MPFEKKWSPEILRQAKDICIRNADKGLRPLARMSVGEFPGFTEKTVRDMFMCCRRATEKVFDMVVAGSLPYAFFVQATGLPAGIQNMLADETVKHGLKQSQIIQFRRFIVEGMSFPEALARVTGNGDAIDQRKEEKLQSIDQLFSSIAKLGSRWRASVALASTMLSQSEGLDGVGLSLFEKVFMLRHLIGEQYDFVDQKVRRYIKTLERRIESRGSSAPIDAAFEPVMEGEEHGAPEGDK